MEGRAEKQQRENDFQICAAHDLAPIYQELFGLKPRELTKNNPKFVKLVKRGGSDAKDGRDWKGPVRR